MTGLAAHRRQSRRWSDLSRSGTKPRIARCSVFKDRSRSGEGVSPARPDAVSGATSQYSSRRSLWQVPRPERTQEVSRPASGAAKRRRRWRRLPTWSTTPSSSVGGHVEASRVDGLAVELHPALRDQPPRLARARARTRPRSAPAGAPAPVLRRRSRPPGSRPAARARTCTRSNAPPPPRPRPRRGSGRRAAARARAWPRWDGAPGSSSSPSSSR